MDDPDGKKNERERNESGASSTGVRSAKDRPRPQGLEVTDGAEASRNASIKQKKLGHRGVDDHGNTVYKKTATTTLMAAIQLGIQHSVGGLSAKPERDVLLQDFAVVESVFFPKEGSNITQAHQYPDFRFKTYAPVAFRYFRDLFGIQPDDYLISLVDQPLRELSNPGASGSVFYLSNDDEFIIKTVQHKEADFLQKLLPGYYMNLNQNPRTLLPKFYGLYTYQSGGRNIRLIVMNNLLPSHLKMHQKFDLKGSTFKRKSSKSERRKASPTLKDLDFLDEIPEGLLLDAHTYNALAKTLQRDCRVLESFKIMDYSLLVAVHNLDQAERERGRTTPTFNGGDGSTPLPETPKSAEPPSVPETPHDLAGEDPSTHPKGAKLERSFSKLRKIAKHVTTREAIQGQSETYMPDTEESCGGIPAKNSKGERLLLFLGIIDILQCYKVKKKLEHTYKALIHDGDTVSVCRPDFYAKRFQTFMLQQVFKKIPPPKHSPSKRRGQAGFYGSSGGRERRRTGESMKDHHSLERGTLPPTTLDKPPASGGAKPKTSRPDLVPSTPPNSEKDAESVDSPRDQPSDTTSSNKKDRSASELSVQTDEGAVSTGRSPERVTVQSSSINETFDLSQPPTLYTMFPYTPNRSPATSTGTTSPSFSPPQSYSGSSTLDDSESSPHKSSNLSVESLGEEGVLSDPEKTPTAAGMPDPEKTPVAENNFAEGMGAYQREGSESRVGEEEGESLKTADENDIELDMTEKDGNILERDSSVRSGTEGDSWL